jgi:hypothetical protein
MVCSFLTRRRSSETRRILKMSIAMHTLRIVSLLSVIARCLWTNEKVGVEAKVEAILSFHTRQAQTSFL